MRHFRNPVAIAATGLLALLIVLAPTSAHAGPLRPILNLAGRGVGFVLSIFGL